MRFSIFLDLCLSFHRLKLIADTQVIDSHELLGAMWKTFWEDWVMGGGIYTRLLELPNVLKRSAANYYIQSNLLTSSSKLLKLQPKLFFV